jgi:hypothetical protein
MNQVIRRLGCSISRAVRGAAAALVVAAATGPAGAQVIAPGYPACGSAPEQPCPTTVERPCYDPERPSGPCSCECGPGVWSARTQEKLIPRTPHALVNQVTSVNGTRWTWSTTAAAVPGHAEASIGLDGVSQFWSTGSLARRTHASQEVLVREEWIGTGIPCPRIVSLAAVGGAMIELGLTCAARQGCTVSGVMGVAGACSSLGSASATLESRTVSGTATYRSLERKVKVSGRIGANVDDDGFGIDGQISSEEEWELDGDGSVVGSAMYSVTHDRTYCAFTNRAYVRRTSGQASAVASGTVSDNGTVAVSGLAVVHLSIA